MSIELEAKMKVESLDATRERLRSLGAERQGSRHEVNAFFDAPDDALRKRDCGLRVRTMRREDGATETVVTYKGPAERGELKRREEIEFGVDDEAACRELFDRLGYGPTLAFEKRRESWSLDGCLVELDELPHLGTFVEIEGEDDAAVMAVRRRLGLEGEPLISTGYIRMVADFVRHEPKLGPVVRFP